MQKHKLDEIRGATCQSGVALMVLVPSQVSKKETEKKEKELIKCKLFGCCGKNHKLICSKKCKYYHCKTKRAYMRLSIKRFVCNIQKNTV